jgi:hypothetical protein
MNTSTTTKRAVTPIPALAKAARVHRAEASERKARAACDFRLQALRRRYNLKNSTGAPRRPLVSPHRFCRLRDARLCL